jgi:hypothetical protein
MGKDGEEVVVTTVEFFWMGTLPDSEPSPRASILSAKGVFLAAKASPRVSSRRRPLGTTVLAKASSPRAGGTLLGGHVPKGPPSSRRRQFHKTNKKNPRPPAAMAPIDRTPWPPPPSPTTPPPPAPPPPHAPKPPSPPPLATPRPWPAAACNESRPRRRVEVEVDVALPGRVEVAPPGRRGARGLDPSPPHLASPLLLSTR